MFAVYCPGDRRHVLQFSFLRKIATLVVDKNRRGRYRWLMNNTRDYRAKTDSALGQLVHEGDLQAFRTVYDRHWRRLYQYTAAIVSSDADAEDIVQDLFIHFWEKSQSEPIEALEGYFHTALRFRILKFFEKNKVRLDHLVSLAHYLERHEPLADEKLNFKDLNRQIEAEISRLPTKMREVFLLRKNDELSYREISKTLKISETTVKKQLYNATKLLKSKFAGYLKTLTVFF